MEIHPALTPEMVKDFRLLNELKLLEKDIKICTAQFLCELTENNTLSTMQLAKHLLDPVEDSYFVATLLKLCGALQIETPQSILAGRPILNVDAVQLLWLQMFAVKEYMRILRDTIFGQKEYQDAPPANN